MTRKRVPKLITQCPACPREIGVRPDLERLGWYRVAAHPGCGGGGIQVRPENVRVNPGMEALRKRLTSM